MWRRSTDAHGGAARAVGGLALLHAVAWLLGALALAGCSGAPSRPEGADATAGPDPAAVARYEVALVALQAGDDAGAEPVLNALADAHPDYAGPLVNLALIRARSGDLDGADALLERAVAVCSNCAAPWNALGVNQRQQGRFADAERSYRNAIGADAGYANAWFNLGVLYDLYLQQPELALEHYGRFRELAAADPMGADVDKWIADLKRRTRPVERSAQVEEPRR